MTRIPSAVLFACTANAVRSPIAAALFRDAHGTRAYVESVGLRAGEPDPFVGVVLGECGIGGVDSHQPKTFDDLQDDNFEIIVALSQEAFARAQEITRTMHCEVVFWPTEDPAEVEGNRETRLDAYRRVRDDLRARILREWPLAGAVAPEPGIPAEVGDALVADRKTRGVKVRRRGRDMWSRMRIGLRKMRR